MTDADIVGRFLAGDESAAADMLAKYRGMVFATAKRYLEGYHDAEEITFEAFARAMRGLRWFQDGRPLGPWLVTICANLAKNRLESFRRLKRNSALAVELSDHIAATDDTRAQVELAEEGESAMGSIEKLTPHHAAILSMRLVDHMSYQEIASREGVAIGTVKSRIARARAELRGAVAA